MTVGQHTELLNQRESSVLVPPAPETDKLNSNMMNFKALIELVWITVMFKQHTYDFLTLSIFVSFK